MRGAAFLLIALALTGCGGEGTPGAPRPAGPAAAPEPETAPEPADPQAVARDRMVRDHMEARGIQDARVLAAMRAVPRHEFVPEEVRLFAHSDQPLPIGSGQTISQPYIVASMTEELHLEPGDKVLEIGTGSGYQAAVLAEITDNVFTIEIVKELADTAQERLTRLGYDLVRCRQADGWHGWEEEAPFAAIVVTAAPRQVPPSLVAQLAPGGRMVIPVGDPYSVQTLVLVTKDDEGVVRTKSLYAVRFVPFTGAAEEDAADAK